MIRAGLILVAVALSARVDAAPVDLWFNQAQTFYQNAQFDSAEHYYRRIAESGVQSSSIFYNLGNSCYRQGKVGEAILQWERARRLNPTDPDIQHNLRYARASIVDRMPEPDRSFLGSALQVLHRAIPLTLQLWIITGLLCALSGLFALGLYVSHNARLWVIYSGCIFVVLLAGIGFSAGAKVRELEFVHQAVVLRSSVDARNGPKGDKVLFTAHEGSTFRIRQKMGEWWFVSLPNGVSGWIESAALGQI